MAQIILQGLNIQEFKELLYETFETKFKVLVQGNQVQSNQVQSNKPAYYSRSEVAKLLKISLPTLNEWSKQGIIQSYRIGKRVLYKTEEIENSLIEVENYKYKRG